MQWMKPKIYRHENYIGLKTSNLWIILDKISLQMINTMCVSNILGNIPSSVYTIELENKFPFKRGKKMFCVIEHKLNAGVQAISVDTCSIQISILVL